MHFSIFSLKIVDITDEVTQISDVEMDNDAVIVDEVNAKKLNKDTRVSAKKFSNGFCLTVYMYDYTIYKIALESYS